MAIKGKNKITSSKHDESPVAKRREMPLQHYVENDLKQISKIINVSHQKSASPYLETTGVKLPGAIYGAATVSRAHLLSEEYLLNYKGNSIDFGPLHGLAEYGRLEVRSAFALIEKKEKELDARSECIELPEPQRIEASFDALVRARRSRSQMTGETLSLEQLSTLLFYGDGVTDRKEVIGPGELSGAWPSDSLGEPDPIHVRSAPSAGALYPIDLYLLLRNVRQVDDGLYRYRPNSHRLLHVKPLSEADWKLHEADAATWGTNFDASKVNVLISHVYSLHKNSRKYGELGLAFGFMEAGMISQNIHLAAGALGLASNCIGSGIKTKREKLLGIDGLSQHCLHQMAIGLPKTQHA